LISIGQSLQFSENAEIVVIKNGVHGALVFEKHNVFEIPVFNTSYVWPIGSGDIFSAIFSWKWIIEKESAYNSAFQASKYTAQYCQTKHLPVREPKKPLNRIEIKNKTKNIYLAGPFFSISERWLINEMRNTLINFGNNVFSPLHDVGIIDTGEIYNNAKAIATKDLEGLAKCDTVLAVITGIDAGTLFEIGYAKSLNKKIVILAQNICENDLTMLIGTGCEITNDFSTAIYKVSW
jgi:nucleoside 2-deoxyribosyltransferase